MPNNCISQYVSVSDISHLSIAIRTSDTRTALRAQSGICPRRRRPPALLAEGPRKSGPKMYVHQNY